MKIPKLYVPGQLEEIEVGEKCSNVIEEPVPQN